MLPDIIISNDFVDGKEEYSVSGWAKFVDPAPGPWNTLVKVSTNPIEKQKNFLGDATFGIWKGEGFHHFCTYTSD